MASSKGQLVPVKRYERTTAGVQDLIFDQIEALQQGKSTTQELRAICSGANVLLSAARLELEAAKHMYTQDAPMPDTPLQLGSDREG